MNENKYERHPTLHLDTIESKVTALLFISFTNISLI
jgi:hypothetical protein